jgi:hypothetical protein
MKTTAQKHDAERRYSFEEYLKLFTPGKHPKAGKENKEYTDDPAEIGRRLAREALQEMKDKIDDK